MCGVSCGRKVGRKTLLFVNKKKQKKLYPLSKWIKVFWFFFSKKNMLAS